MTTFTETEAERLEAAISPYGTAKIAALVQSGRRLAHYTTAEVAFSIISKAEVWMRNAQTMNDFSEIRHGFACLQAATDQGLTDRFFAQLEAIKPGASQEARNLWQGWHLGLRFNTFLTCVSEHLGSDNSEDIYGRLSMWRAYGGKNGVALIVNPAFLRTADMGNVTTSPVLYADPPGFCQEFERVIVGFEACAELLARQDVNYVARTAFNVLLFGVLCTKHPGFREEREWRVIYTPWRGTSRYVVEDTAVVDGVPQVIQKLQLRSDPDNGVDGLDIAQLVEMVLVGPTDFQMTLTETFHKALEKAGVADPGLRIRFSNIPLRR